MKYNFGLEVGIFAGGSVSFTGETPTKRDLGGAEYCCVSMAEALTRLGHRVSVFTKDSREVYQNKPHIIYNGVNYFPMERTWRNINHATMWDVFIISREYPILSNTTLNSKLTILWNHDILTDPDSFREHIHRADKIYCLSTYHKQQYLRKLTDEVTGKSTLKPEHISLTRNGVDVDLIQQALRANTHRPDILNGKFKVPTFIYSSRPERGLKYLLRDIWPHILEKIPNAQLKVACYDVDQELLPDFVKQIHLECYELIRRNPASVQFVGALPRMELFQTIAACQAMIYPSIFNEISCLSVLESQALGTPVLTSERGALKESNWSDEHIIFDSLGVENGIYTGKPGERGKSIADWISDFIDNYWKHGECVDRDLIREDIQEHHDWNKIAQEWENDFYHHFEQRAITKPKRIIQNLINNSDLLAAQWALLEASNGTGKVQLKENDFHQLDTEVRNHLTYHHAEPEVYSDKCGDEHENIYICPDRMKIALDLIEQKYGHEQPFTLLDIGCGAGRFLYHVLKNFHNCQVMGIDFSWQLCAQARKNLTDAFPSLGEDVGFIQHCDLLEINLDEFFGGTERADVVFCGEYLEHQTELVQALTKVDACVKEGGLVIYTTPYGAWEAISFGDAYTKDGHEIRFHVSHFEHRDFEEMFKYVNYKVEASYIQHSPLDASVIGNFVVSYEKLLKRVSAINSVDDYIHEWAQPVQFYTPNYYRKFLTTRPYIRVGGLLIAKDEEDNITRALKPLQKRVDHILVYDTGSTDKTRELACEYAHDVIKGYWDDDFGAARNRALDILLHYDIDAVLWQDCDEILLNGYKIRHYLQGDLEIYPGFIILQSHLMIDMPVSSDIPIRLFRNKPEYRWIGKIHEHIMDNRDPDGNTNLFPLYILPDVKIAHYGYVTEDERRWKAQHRNWDILKEDLKAYPNREMGKIFLMRDYIHHVRWNLEKKRPLTDKDIELLYDVIEKYQQFKEPDSQNHVLARLFYQDALKILGEANYPGPDGRIPIHAALTIAAKRGSLPQEQFQPEMRWFKDAEEMNWYVARQLQKSQTFLNKKPRIFED